MTNTLQTVLPLSLLFPAHLEAFCPLPQTRRWSVNSDPIAATIRNKRHDLHILLATPKGRVEDMDAWIQLSSDSLKKFTGQSLFDYMNVTEPSQVHDHERFAVLSHGVQDDPIYCYFNKAAFLQFQFSEDEVYQLPSRYSAPDGEERTARQSDVEQAVQEDLKQLSSVIRQTKHGDLFEMVNVLLWNVYDENGERVGQTAIYDRDLVRPVSSSKQTDKDASSRGGD